MNTLPQNSHVSFLLSLRDRAATAATTAACVGCASASILGNSLSGEQNISFTENDFFFEQADLSLSASVRSVVILCSSVCLWSLVDPLHEITRFRSRSRSSNPRIKCALDVVGLDCAHQVGEITLAAGSSRLVTWFH